MKLSFITPTNFIQKYQKQGDFVLGLSHLMKLDKVTAYEKAIVNTKLPIVLDNGLFENHVPEPLQSLIKKAIKINATHFFVPDMLYDTKGTKESLQNAILTVKKMKKNLSKEKLKNFPKIAAVVQADNDKDYWKQLREFNQNPEVEMIGLSILAIPKSFKRNIRKYDITKSRMYLLRKMKQETKAFGYKWKPCHLLGLGNSYEDVFYAAKHCPFVVSNDTSSAFWNGVQRKSLVGKNCEVSGGKTKIPVDFNFKIITSLQQDKIQKNIDLVKTNLKKYDKSN